MLCVSTAVGGTYTPAADTRVDCSEEATRSFAEYMDMPFDVHKGRQFWESLLEALVLELYLWDRGDHRMVCAGPIYYFTAEDAPSPRTVAEDSSSVAEQEVPETEVAGDATGVE